MKGLDNQLYVILLIISNVVAILQLVASVRWPRLSRLSFFILFTWACWINWTTALQNPAAYLEYANLTWSGWYKSFINGWFSNHIVAVIGTIATCQALIAVSMLLKGWLFKTGCMGAIVFLLSILPFGVGAGFPATGIMAIACLILARKRNIDFIWKRSKLSLV